jgi:hypothetical protein
MVIAYLILTTVFEAQRIEFSDLVTAHQETCGRLWSGVITAEVRVGARTTERWSYAFDPTAAVAQAEPLAPNGGIRAHRVDRNSMELTTLFVPPGADVSLITVFDQRGVQARSGPHTGSMPYAGVPWMLMRSFRRNATAEDYTLRELATYQKHEVPLRVGEFVSFSLEFPPETGATGKYPYDTLEVTCDPKLDFSVVQVTSVHNWGTATEYYPPMSLSVKGFEFDEVAPKIWLPRRVTLAVTQDSQRVDSASWEANLIYKNINEMVATEQLHLMIPENVVMWCQDRETNDVTAKLFGPKGTIAKEFIDKESLSQYRIQEHERQNRGSAQSSKVFLIVAILSACVVIGLFVRRRLRQIS